MRQLLLCSSIVLCAVVSNAQQTPLIDSLKKNLQQSSTAEQKVFWLEQLASWSVEIDRNQADEFLYKEYEIAELSHDNKLRWRALWDNAFAHMNSTKGDNDTAVYYATKMMAIAKNENNQGRIVSATLALANAALVMGETEKGISHVNEANAIASGLHNDTLSLDCHFAYYNAYMAKNQKLPAFRSLINALNVSEQLNDPASLLSVYGELASFYHGLGNGEKARDYHLKALALTLSHKKPERRFAGDYFAQMDAATFESSKPYERVRIYDQIGVTYTDDKEYGIAMQYFENGLQLADSLRLPVLRNAIYNHIMRQYFLMGDYAKAFDFFKTRTDLQESYISHGAGFFGDMLQGRLLFYTGQKDAAGFYFQKAEPQVDRYADNKSRDMFYDWYADYYAKTGQFQKAIVYYTKQKTLAAQTNNLDALKSAAANLDSIYQKLGDYKSAYAYNRLYHQYQDSITTLTNEKEIVSAEIDNAAKQQEKELQEQEERKRERYDVQYMGIAAALAAFIILLVMTGVFKVSVATIKALGFFTFIFLFEFIVLLTDAKIHDLTNGEPWKVMLIKIGLAALLIPLHHYLEHKVIRYLSTEKLFVIKKDGFWKKFAISKKKKAQPVQEPVT